MFHSLFIFLMVLLAAASFWLTAMAFRYYLSVALFLGAGLGSFICAVLIAVLYETEMKTGTGVGFYAGMLYFFSVALYCVAIGQAGFGLFLIIRNLFSKRD